MAKLVTIGGNGVLFVGEDKVLTLTVVDAAEVPVNIVGWGIVFDVRTTDTAADPPILSKTATVSGVYNADPTQNTQKATVSLTDDDMNLFKQRNYRHSWKRTDAGGETVLAWGNFTPQKATAP